MHGGLHSEYAIKVKHALERHSISCFVDNCNESSRQQMQAASSESYVKNMSTHAKGGTRKTKKIRTKFETHSITLSLEQGQKLLYIRSNHFAFIRQVSEASRSSRRCCRVRKNYLPSYPLNVCFTFRAPAREEPDGEPCNCRPHHRAEGEWATACVSTFVCESRRARERSVLSAPS